MNRFLPILTGILTSGIFGIIAVIFWSESRWVWASLFSALFLYRVIAMARQAYYTFSPEEFDDTDEVESV